MEAPRGEDLMIAADQPTIFPDGVLVAVSSVEDGSMKDGTELMTPEAVHNRTHFLQQLGMPPAQAAIHFASFETDDYCVYEEAVAGLMPGVDAVSTSQCGQPMLLPIADCVATVLYDPVQHVLMVSHLGRHSVEQDGGTKSVAHIVAHYGSKPADLLVWLGPSPNAKDYPLWKFNNRGFIDVLCEQLQAAGVTACHIEVSRVDTATDHHYFSHSQYLKGQQAIDGRYAVAAMLT